MWRRHFTVVKLTWPLHGFSPIMAYLYPWMTISLIQTPLSNLSNGRYARNRCILFLNYSPYFKNNIKLYINTICVWFYEKVWLGLGVSIVFVTATLILILRFSFHLSTIWRSNTIEVEKSNEENVRSPERDGRFSVMENKCRKQYLYVIGNLLSQGFLLSFKIYN